MEKLIITEPYVSILPSDYTEPILEKVSIPEADFVKVKWLKAHVRFSYNAGQIGKVTSDNFKMLTEADDGPFVERYREEGKPGIWGKLKNQFLK